MANIRGIVEEYIRVNWSAMKIIIKIIPIFHHFVYTGFGISKSSYSSSIDPIGGSGQGNMFVGNIYRDKSSFIINSIS